MLKRYVIVDLKTNRYLLNPYSFKLEFGPIDEAYQFDWSDSERGWRTQIVEWERDDKLDYLEDRILSVVTVYIG